MATKSLRLLALSMAISSAVAQAPAESSSIRGTVTNSKTGEPVKRALVTIRCGTYTRARPEPVTSSAMSGESGGFIFPIAGTSSCYLTAQKPGFEMARQAIEEAALRESVSLKLEPYGVITGRVIDDRKRPVRGVAVLALRRTIQDGLKQTSRDGTVATDDRGVFRAWNLRPGSYYVKAAGLSGGTYLYAADTSPRFRSDEAFAPAYYGGGATVDTAAPVLVEPGTEAQVEIGVAWQSGFRIAGQLEGFLPRQTVRFELMSGEEETTPSRVSVNADTGVFEIQDVVAGAYTLRAIQGETVAERNVVVSGADVRGVTLTPAAPVEIEVKQQVIGDATEIPNMPVHSRQLGWCAVRLRPLGRPEEAINAKYPLQREQNLTGILPGRYRVRLDCSFAYPRSAMAGTQDLLLDPVLTVQPGVKPPAIELVVARGGGRVLGTIQPAPEDGKAGVILVPHAVASTGPASSIVNGGRFEFYGVAPGTYTAFAFSNLAEVEYRNPEVLKSLGSGTAVQVAENQDVSIVLPGVVR